QNIASSSKAKSGVLAYWNVSRLNGKYTVLLKSGSFIAAQDVYAGTLIKSNEQKSVYSAYRRAQLTFPPGAFDKDTLATITPVTMSEIKIRNRPIIMTHGPIVEIKPSPAKFKTPKEDGIDLRPTLRFFYTLDDLKNLGITPDPANPTKNLGLNIHQITALGDLQVISANEQTYANELYCFSGPLDHFSTYTLTKGKIKLSAPIVLAERYITNQDTVNIYGTAEAESELEIFISGSPLQSNVGVGLVPTRGEASENGSFRFENIKLLQEGENYIYVFSHPKGNPDVKTQSDVMIIKDTIAPSIEVYPNLQIFSPNNDGKWDSVEYDLSSNEKGKIGFIIKNPEGKIVVNEELETEANQTTKLVWGKNGFNIYRRGKSGDWDLLRTISAAGVFNDGIYSYAVYGIDEAGNISNNVIGKTEVDTTPPKIENIKALPNPFTPNEDGIKDTTTISFNLSEPAYATTKIYREDGGLFRKYSEVVDGLVVSWPWDGKGSRNELLGGTYTYNIEAEDKVGNYASSESKTIIVDREPALIAYAYADPDPFAPVNPKNDFTEIKYYIARDNVEVSASILGREDKIIKKLVHKEITNKGEHAARWYGDFHGGYDGPKAEKDKNKIGDGSYVFKVEAIDPDTQRLVETTNTVLVDNVPPHIILNPLVIDYAAKKATLTYTIPEISSV
ncbi:MAG: leukocidin/Hemolysin toxin family, partial [Candidatus Saganbacteria bacterium]